MKARKVAEAAARERGEGQDEHGWYIDAMGGRHATSTARKWANERHERDHGMSAGEIAANRKVEKKDGWYVDKSGTRHATETAARWANERHAKNSGGSGGNSSQ